MALAEVARFFDLTEAQAAAGLLRSGGVFVHVEREFEGAALPMLGLFSPGGGYALWAAKGDADTARALLADFRQEESRGYPARLGAKDIAAMAATTAVVMTFGPLAAWTAVGALRRRGWVLWTAIAITLLATAVFATFRSVA